MFGGLNPINVASTVATAAATGGTSLIAQAALKLASAVGQEIIQQLGSAVGAPQGAIDAAQGVFAGTIGDSEGARTNLNEAIDGFGAATGSSPSDIGETQREVEQAVQDVVNDAGQSKEMKEAKGNGGKSWLMAIAKVLGDKLEKMAGELTDLAQQAADDPKKGTMFAAKSQEFGILSGAVTNGIKSIGEGMAGMARKG